MTLFAELNRRVIIGVLVLVILMIAAERFWTSGTEQRAGAEPVAQNSAPVNPVRPEISPMATVDRSIAVLPFTNRSAGMENTRFFSDGIHDNLLTNLSKIHQLKVISRTSVMGYRDSTRNMREIGDELGVANLLEGGVQQAGDRVRINVQLINAKTDEHIWAETYDREVTAENIFEIQGEIARAIAQALRATLTTAENDALGKAQTSNLEAYRAVLVSRQIARRNGFGSFDRGVKFAREAVRLDPAYPDAHLALAHVLSEGINTGAISDEEAGAEISAAIETAMKLKPDYDEAWSVLGNYQAVTRNPDADRTFEKAMQLNPGNGQTMYSYGYMLQSTGRPEKALPLLLKSSELDPLSANVLFAIGRTYDVLERYDEARAVYARIREIEPSSPLGYAPNSRAYFPEGRLAEALYWMRHAQTLDPQDFELAGWMVFLHDNLEDYVAAQEWSEWLDSWITKQPQPMAMQARHHYLTGNFELALQYANLAIRLGLDNRWNSDSIFMRIKRDEALANGDPEAGIGVFAAQHPRLFEPAPEITPDNALQAVDLALLLDLAGRKEETRKLLGAVLEAYQQPYFTTGSMRSWLVPVKAQALALLGDGEGALQELRRIIDNGWRLYWRWDTELNPNFNGIRNTEEFKAMVTELEADMDRQRTRAQEMADGGEIAPPQVI